MTACPGLSEGLDTSVSHVTMNRHPLQSLWLRLMFLVQSGAASAGPERPDGEGIPDREARCGPIRDHPRRPAPPHPREVEARGFGTTSISVECTAEKWDGLDCNANETKSLAQAGPVVLQGSDYPSFRLPPPPRSRRSRPRTQKATHYYSRWPFLFFPGGRGGRYCTSL